MFINLKAVIKTLLTCVLICILAITFTRLVKPVYAHSLTDDFSEVDIYIRETMKNLPIKGLALAIVEGDEILYMQGYGVANAQGDPATAQTPWPMGSVTKAFTALAIRQLAVDGKVNLNGPLQTYLPEFQLANAKAASSITINHLLNHTSGISKVEGEAPYLNSPKTTFTENIGRLAKFLPDYQPGEHEEYSNWNYVLLAQVVTRVSGQSYAEYIHENIFTPLGMTNSSFIDYQDIPNLATGNLITFGISVPYNEKFVPGMVGAGYLTSTSEDMAHYLSLVLGEGKYFDQSLLPASGTGHYGTMWDWIKGTASPDTVYGLSGGHNSISTTCLTYPRQDLGVVLLLNTRLDQLPGVSSYDIALGIGNIILQKPYQVPPGKALYTPWVILDVSILLLIAVIIWQGSGLKGWRSRYQSFKSFKKFISWVGIILEILISFVILFLPKLAGSRWDTILFMRPDFGIPLIAIAAFLGCIGIIKAVKSSV